MIQKEATLTNPKAKEATIEEKMAAKEAAWLRRPAILDTSHRLHLGDAREMGEVTGPVHLVVTSPPYWNRKKYAGEAGAAQLGHIDGRLAFLSELEKVWRRCFELLEPGGRLCVVVGDVCRSRKEFGRHLVDPIHAYIQTQCQALGFDPLAPILWHKIANAKSESGGGVFLGKPYEPNAIIKNDIEYILIFRKPGGYRKPTQEQRDLSMIAKEDHRRWFQSFWTDVPGASLKSHPAPFPVEVPRRLIGMFSFVGDTVLDPFAGTGSTMLAAREMHRNSIGFEIEPSYLAQAQARLASNKLPLLG